jgi:DNA polymerase III epsilon subunit family exonuclease
VKRLDRWLRRHRPPADDRPLGLLREGDFVAIDLETTGLDPQRDVPVSVAAVSFQGGKPVLGFETLLNPGRPIPVASTLIHGISDTMVAAAPRLDDVLDELDALCADRVLVGHGIAFDLAVLARARRDCRRPPLGNAALCTMRLAAALHPGWSDVTLESVASRLGVPVTGRHTARGDAVIAGAVMVELIPQLTRLGHRSVGDALWLQDRVLL